MSAEVDGQSELVAFHTKAVTRLLLSESFPTRPHQSLKRLQAAKPALIAAEIPVQDSVIFPRAFPDIGASSGTSGHFADRASPVFKASSSYPRTSKSG